MLDHIFEVFIKQLYAQTFSPVTILLVLSYLGGLTLYHIKDRRKMLGLKFASDSSGALYYYLMGGNAGAFGAMIAATGSLVQSLTPNHLMKKTQPYRIAAAVMLASLGIYVTAQRTSDLLPLIAVIFARFIELSSNAQKIRIGMVMTFPAWMIYNFNNELYLLFLLNITVLCSAISAIIRHSRQPKEAVPDLP